MRMPGISRIPCARGADVAVSPREFEIFVGRTDRWYTHSVHRRLSSGSS
jgi:hypothetical protein